MDLEVRSRKEPDGERFFPPVFPSLETVSDSCHSEPTQQPSLFTVVFGGLKLCGLVPVPGNAWTRLAEGKPSCLCSFGVAGSHLSLIVSRCQSCLTALCHTPRCD